MIKSYEQFLNEGLFDFFKKDPKSRKRKKNKKELDQEMNDLLDEIVANFDAKNLSWKRNDRISSFGTPLAKVEWTYILNDMKIVLKKEEIVTGSVRYLFYLDGKLLDENISVDLLVELGDFFEKYEKKETVKQKDLEKKEKIKKDSEIFNKTISSRIDADKYNL